MASREGQTHGRLALIEGRTGAATLDGRAKEARRLVETLEEAAVAAVREGLPADATALAQARADFEALSGAIAQQERERRAAAALAERERIAGIKAQVATATADWLDGIDEVEAAA